MARCNSGQQVAHDVGAAAHILKKAGCRHLVKNHLGHRHGQRVAGKGRAVRSGGHGVADSVTCDDRANRKPAAKALCHGYDIRRDAGCLIGEQCAGPANAGLHLVSDDQRAELIRRRANAAQIIIMGVTGTALTLHGLNHHRRDMIAKRGAKRVQIAKGNMVETIRHRPEAGPVCRLVGGRQHAKCPPMERAGGAQDGGTVRLPPLIGGTARHLDGGFIGLGTGITEIDLIEAGQRRQLFRHPFLPRHPVQVRGVPQLAGLVAQRVDQRRMRMAKRVHGNTACAVKIALAIIGNQPAAIPANEGQIGAAIGFHHRRCRRFGCLRRSHVEIRFRRPVSPRAVVSLPSATDAATAPSARASTYKTPTSHPNIQGPKNQTTSTSTTAPVVSFAAAEGCQIRHFGQTCQGVWAVEAGQVSPE